MARLESVTAQPIDLVPPYEKRGLGRILAASANSAVISIHHSHTRKCIPIDLINIIACLPDVGSRKREVPV